MLKLLLVQLYQDVRQAALTREHRRLGRGPIEEDPEVQRQLLKEALQEYAVGLVACPKRSPETRSKRRNPSEAVPFRTHSTTKPRSSQRRRAASRLSVVNETSSTSRS